MGMKRIYTRTGDNGLTAIHGGSRVAKTDIRIEANGTLDELNVAIGTVRSFLPVNHVWQETLKDIQTCLMSLMSIVATPNEIRNTNPNRLPMDCVISIEKMIDSISETYEEPDYFVLPGGSPTASFLHQCRVTARKAERRLWQLHEIEELPEIILQYINRLSDLFFVMARREAREGNIGEERWKQFAYKRKRNENNQGCDAGRDWE
ncbi:MAG: cob(I)yrinic acid a,c-diamide adenosyltransferase [Lachnospiraceae bacterium]|nr:cob(I)yrinic acid a,c-diamide adenosyltransferase [Lachnospiraceae bacterium]